MNQNESLPWTDVYRNVLDDASRFTNLSEGLSGEASISTFPDGFLTMWDLSGFTRVVKELDGPAQSRLSEAIFNGALDFGERIRSVIIQPPPGDQGAYYSSEDPGDLPTHDLARQIEEDAYLPQNSLSVKAVVIPHHANSLFLGTFLSPQIKGNQAGYTALMGPAYTRGLSRLSRMGKSDIVRTERPKPFMTASFREIDLSKPRVSREHVDNAVKILSKRMVPEGRYMHAVLKAWDVRGKTNLVDPFISAALASAFLEHRRAWSAVKQDEGHLHIVSEEQPEEARASLREIVESIERDVGFPDTKIESASVSVRHPVRLQVRDHVDFAGMHVIDLVHRLKGKVALGV